VVAAALSTSPVDENPDGGEDEHVTPAKVILSKQKVETLLREPREKGASTAQQDACEPFLVVFLWLPFVTGRRCENL
jgi:hypothetical protein